MSKEEIELNVKRANTILPQMYRSFLECVYNEKENSIVYSFKDNNDAEQFKLWKELSNNPYRLQVIPHHTNWSTVTEHLA